MKNILLILGLIISFNIYAQQGVMVENIEHKGNLTAFLLYEQGNDGVSGYIVADCNKQVFGYGDLSGTAIDRPDTISFENFAVGTPNEKYALEMVCTKDNI